MQDMTGGASAPPTYDTTLVTVESRPFEPVLRKSVFCVGKPAR